MKCPRCGSECERDEVDNGVGMEACGLWGCFDCHWVQGEPVQAPQPTKQEITSHVYIPRMVTGGEGPDQCGHLIPCGKPREEHMYPSNRWEK